MQPFSRNAAQAIALLAVDNVCLSKEGLKLFSAVDSGEMTIEDAKEAIKARARAYGCSTTIKTTPRIENTDPQRRMNNSTTSK